MHTAAMSARDERKEAAQPAFILSRPEQRAAQELRRARGATRARAVPLQCISPTSPIMTCAGFALDE